MHKCKFGFSGLKSEKRDRPWAALSMVDGINSFVFIRWPILRKRTLHLMADPNNSEVWTLELFYGCLMHPIPAALCNTSSTLSSNHWKISTNVKRFVVIVVCGCGNKFAVHTLNLAAAQCILVGVAVLNLNRINALNTLMNGQRLRTAQTNSWR